MIDRVFNPEVPRGIPVDARGTVATVGTFDGVHRGHWAVLEEIRRRARDSGRRSVLVTFDPHPLRIVKPEMAPKLLTSPIEKKEILAESGLDYAVFLHFTPALAEFSPRRFVEEVLIGRLGVEELVIGYDHGFGRGRSGDADTLRGIGREMGFAVDVVESVAFGAAPISSSRIRKLIGEGKMVEAADGLGRSYSVRGRVVLGEGRGRALGFPTANLHVSHVDKQLPPEGIYAVRGVLRRGTFPGALHLGPRPTFQGSPPSFELHLMDFTGDLYGEEVRVDFIEKLREIRSYPTVDGLIRQMHADVENARRILDGSRERVR